MIEKPVQDGQLYLSAIIYVRFTFNFSIYLIHFFKVKRQGDLDPILGHYSLLKSIL